MYIFKHKLDLQSFILAQKQAGKTVGFVPTMGALHQGHTALVKRSNTENSLTVVSIFVNPTQFNNAGDLAKYPRTIDTDIEKLIEADCTALFLPEVDEMYEEVISGEFDFGYIGTVYEGEYRPGHFNGVATIVKKFFEIITPTNAYFGKKDYQQWLIVTDVAKKLNTGINVVGCPTIREEDGLAMSSRNLRLSREERAVAGKIPKALFYLKDAVGKTNFNEAVDNARKSLISDDLIELEYLDIVDSKTLLPLNSWDSVNGITAITALKVGEIRLIDNLQLTE